LHHAQHEKQAEARNDDGSEIICTAVQANIFYRKLWFSSISFTARWFYIGGEKNKNSIRAQPSAGRGNLINLGSDVYKIGQSLVSAPTFAAAVRQSARQAAGQCATGIRSRSPRSKKGGQKKDSRKFTPSSMSSRLPPRLWGRFTAFSRAKKVAVKFGVRDLKGNYQGDIRGLRKEPPALPNGFPASKTLIGRRV